MDNQKLQGIVDRLQREVAMLKAKVEKLEKAEEERSNKEFGEDLYKSMVAVFTEMVEDEEYDWNYIDFFFDKYSKERYKELGLSKDFFELDIRSAIEEARNLNNRAKKLHYWRAFHRKAQELLSDFEYSRTGEWMELHNFVLRAIEFYQSDVMQYILEKGKYVDVGGRNKEIGEKEVIHLWEKYSNDPEYIHEENKRYKGEPKKGEIYKKIASDIGEPTAKRTIRNIIKNYLN